MMAAVVFQEKLVIAAYYGDVFGLWVFFCIMCPIKHAHCDCQHLVFGVLAVIDKTVR